MDWRKFFQQIAAQILGSVSANLLVGLKDFATSFRTEASKTENPWDDILADFICGMLGIPAAEKK